MICWNFSVIIPCVAYIKCEFSGIFFRTFFCYPIMSVVDISWYCHLSKSLMWNQENTLFPWQSKKTCFIIKTFRDRTATPIKITMTVPTTSCSKYLSRCKIKMFIYLTKLHCNWFISDCFHQPFTLCPIDHFGVECRACWQCLSWFSYL